MTIPLAAISELLCVRFNPLASAVIRLPELTGSALASVMDFNRAARAISGLPLMSRIRQLATHIQSLVEDVHSEATDMFTACICPSVPLSTCVSSVRLPVSISVSPVWRSVCLTPKRPAPQIPPISFTEYIRNTRT